ncbi:uridine phosphorylase 2 isoform X3 [Drosophila gunungcola]|uniref:uridine phosphorylase 2 isoform X3 n=1 Tax=Drosophila gunungcola TaxID=103775 RepID=UPI0022E262D7|nr:uridine phosphorylase 2 isoform X3 [Drosophila gunungcola]
MWSNCSDCTCRLAKEVCQLKAVVNAQSKTLSKLVRQMKDGCNKDEQPKESTLCGLNPCLKCLQPDILYHLGLDTETTDFPKVFGDVRFVCMGGTPGRMENFAYYLMQEIGLKINAATKLRDMAEAGKRFALFKVGPVLCASHGMGCPSISILLHELIKMMHHAKCQDPVFIRIGTCGGIGVDPGTVVISSEAVDGRLNPAHEILVHGVSVQHASQLDEGLADDIKSCHDPSKDNYETIIGRTMCTHDFYEGQSRLDGAFCEYTPEMKKTYLEELQNQGVKNIEMESLALAALTSRANIRAAVVCVAILNRLNGDQIKTPHEILAKWEKRPQVLVARYIRKVLYFHENDSDWEEPDEDECEGEAPEKGATPQGGAGDTQNAPPEEAE